METKDTADRYWLVTHCVRSQNDGYKSVIMITVHQVASHHYTEMWRWSCVMLDVVCAWCNLQECCDWGVSRKRQTMKIATQQHPSQKALPVKKKKCIWFKWAVRRWANEIERASCFAESANLALISWREPGRLGLPNFPNNFSKMDGRANIQWWWPPTNVHGCIFYIVVECQQIQQIALCRS